MLVVSVGDVKVEGIWVWFLLIPWPTFPLIMAAEAGGGTIGEFIAFAVSAGANAVLYGLVGGFISFCYRRFKAR